MAIIVHVRSGRHGTGIVVLILPGKGIVTQPQPGLEERVEGVIRLTKQGQGVDGEIPVLGLLAANPVFRIIAEPFRGLMQIFDTGNPFEFPLTQTLTEVIACSGAVDCAVIKAFCLPARIITKLGKAGEVLLGRVCPGKTPAIPAQVIAQVKAFCGKCLITAVILGSSP